MAPNPNDLRRNSFVGPYVVRALRARSGFATVYRAKHRHTGQQVALKLLHEDFARSPKIVERFRREIRTIASIRHPNVVEVLDYGGSCLGRPFFVMEWCSGSTLRTALDDGAFRLDEAIPIIEQLVSALEAVHAAGVIHRDIKPSNVILSPTDGPAPLVKLIDFGLVRAADEDTARGDRLTTTGVCVGTPYSMAPEQINAQKLDERTDIYGMGILVYEMLTGHRPFRAASLAGLVNMHVSAPPPEISRVAPVPEGLDKVISRCLAKQREERFGSVQEFFTAFMRAVRDPSSRATRATMVPGVTLRCDMVFTCSEDELEDDELDQMDAWLSHAVSEFAVLGLEHSVDFGTGFCALSALPLDRAEEVEVRKQIVESALELARVFSRSTRGRLKAIFTLSTGPLERGADGALRGIDDVFTDGVRSAVASSSVFASPAMVAGLDPRWDLESVVDSFDFMRVVPSPA